MYLAIDSLVAEIKGFSFNAVTSELKAQHEEAKSKIESNSRLSGELVAGIAEQHSSNSRVLSVSGSSAEIMVTGVMVKSMSFMAWLMGATAYSEITAAAQAVDADSDIKEVQLRIDSGGGTVAGMMSCLNAVKAISKPTVAIIDGTCGSAAYAIAAQCDSIVALSNGEIVGSVGAMMSMSKDKDEETVDVRGDNSEKKNADAFTESGFKARKEEVNDFENIYLQAVADGRGVSIDVVKSTYGNGIIMSAQNALKSGMIDSIAYQGGVDTQSNSPTNLTAQGETEHNLTANSEEVMNKAELQAKHPELYAEIKNEGIQAGKSQEQERVSAFAELGEASGAGELAMACIKDGTEHSASINAKFMAAQMKNNSLSALAADNVDTDNIVPKAPAAKSEEEQLDEETIKAFGANKMETF
ncbi:ClpP/crotonase-like domain protein [Vibrio phage 1.223.O._10N.261.48.A9]|nr:ClpP/crotonase-like domain protein [Vibrio phage 1.223.O._10N.261.48.A9]